MPTLQSQIQLLDAAFRRMCEGDQTTLETIPALLQEILRQANDLERRQRELSSLYQTSQDIASILSLDTLLGSILDRAIALVGAERGFLVLGSGVDEYAIPVARHFDQTQEEGREAGVSRALVRRVLATREPVVTTNAQEDPRFQTSHSIITYQIRSVLAVPMITKQELIGAIYVDTRLKARLFDQSDLDLLVAMANQAAVAIELSHLYEDLQTRNLELRGTLNELRATQDELILAERMSVVGRMAASIVHDLKNPMTTIQGYAMLLARPDLPLDRREHFASMITDAIDSFVGMTQEILDYARGGGILQTQELDLAAFLSAFCEFIEPDFATRGLNLRQEFHSPGVICLDATKMRRALYNIASNARDALPVNGTLTVSAVAKGDAVEVRMADTGPGIPEEIQESLFEPFVTHGKATGTGLGLAIARKTIEDHGGTIWVESTPGKGATFVIRLPLFRPSAETAIAGEWPAGP